MHHAFSFLISIHLMLLFIRMAAVGGERSIVFQYISCYCLSVSGFDSFISAHLFQYISCYCLSGLSLGLFNDQADFNTSHVTVYLLQQRRSVLFAFNFNTSHVTVYLTPRTPTIMVPTFQYISCYCLSSLVIIWFLVPPSFQYISCYCLSISKSFYNCFLTISIHLMLLFIFSLIALL